MIRLFFPVFFSLMVLTARSQQVTINGTTGNRPLLWSDFTGKPDKSSEWSALTAWNLGYKVDRVNFRGDTAILEGLRFELELDPKKSWLKNGKETDALLKHEQGHFNIALLFQAALIKESRKMVFFRPDFQSKINSLYAGLYKKYRDLDAKYDEETQHSKNAAAQEQWDRFIKNESEGMRN